MVSYSHFGGFYAQLRVELLRLQLIAVVAAGCFVGLSASHVFQWPSMPLNPQPGLASRGEVLFLMWTIFKVFTECATTLLLFHVLAFRLWGTCDLAPQPGIDLVTPCIGRWSSNCWTPGEVPRDVHWHGLYGTGSFWPKETQMNRNSAWTHPLLVQPSLWVCLQSLLDPCLALWAQGPFWKTWLSLSSTQEPVFHIETPPGGWFLPSHYWGTGMAFWPTGLPLFARVPRFSLGVASMLSTPPTVRVKLSHGLFQWAAHNFAWLPKTFLKNQVPPLFSS